MKIRSIELTNFKKFVGTVRVEAIGGNVNVLVGRNERQVDSTAGHQRRDLRQGSLDGEPREILPPFPQPDRA